MPRGLKEDEPKKPKKGFLDRYKTYDPAVDGYGSVDQWGSLFDAAMDGKRAITVMSGANRTPLQVLGFPSLPTRDELRSRYRKLILELRAAFGESPTPEETSRATEIIAAYTVLNSQTG